MESNYDQQFRATTQISTNDSHNLASGMRAHEDTEQGRDLWLAFLIANSPDRAGNSALIIATHAGSFEAVSLLLSHGADPNFQNSQGMSALHIAAEKGNIQIAELLLFSGADPNLTNRHSKSPLLHAIYHGHAQLIPLLIAYGADPYNLAAPAMNAFKYAIRYRQTGALETLLFYARQFGYTICTNELIEMAVTTGQVHICQMIANQRTRFPETVGPSVLAFVNQQKLEPH